MQNDETVGVVLIDFNSQSRTTQYISDLLSATDVPIANIAVIDNTPDLNNFYDLEKSLVSIGLTYNLDIVEFKEDCIDKYVCGNIGTVKILLLHSKINLGFAKANNLGLRVIKQVNKIKYILFSNSDILFLNNKIELSVLINILEGNKSGFVIGPSVIYPDGRPQSPCRYISIYRRWWRQPLMWPIVKSLKPNKREVIEDALEGSVYRIIGAFMLTDVKKFEEVGCFDESTFLYAEELILAERGKKYGYDVLYTPKVKLVHENGYTVGKSKTPASRDFKICAMLKSDLYYYEKYIGVSKFTIYLTKFIVRFYLFKLHLKDRIVGFFGEKH